jgi:hypothetical protein
MAPDLPLALVDVQLPHLRSTQGRGTTFTVRLPCV